MQQICKTRKYIKTHEIGQEARSEAAQVKGKIQNNLCVVILQKKHYNCDYKLTSIFSVEELIVTYINVWDKILSILSLCRTRTCPIFFFNFKQIQLSYFKKRRNIFFRSIVFLIALFSLEQNWPYLESDLQVWVPPPNPKPVIKHHPVLFHSRYDLEQQAERMELQSEENMRKMVAETPAVEPAPNYGIPGIHE